MRVGAAGDAPPFMVMDIVRRANAAEAARQPGDPRILRLEVGQPGTGAPAGAVAAAEAALRSGRPLGYTEALGLAPLRHRITAHYADWYGLDLDPGRIAVTSGASGAFPLAFLAAFDRGDVVAMAAPYYPPYVNILVALGMRPVILPATAETGFQPTVAMLEALHPRPAGLIVASPSNPAGSTLPRQRLAEIADWCDRNEVRLISDEIYHGLTYGEPPTTLAALSRSAIVVNSFSKYFGMTGWRIGWMVLPAELVRPVECLAQNMMISAPHLSQVAAEAAFGCHPELQERVAGYHAARDMLLGALPPRWFGYVPAGAFYLYADLGEGSDSVDFCHRALTQIGIACSPGLDFDAARGHRFVRFSYAGPTTDMAEAAKRLGNWGLGPPAPAGPGQRPGLDFLP